MRAFASTMRCSAARRSGRCSSSAEGSPAGTSGGIGCSFSAMPRATAPGLRPRRIESRFSVSAICFSSSGTAATAASYCRCAWARSSSLATPRSYRLFTMRSDSARVSRVRTAIPRSWSRARNAKYACATSLTSVMTTVRCASSVARRFAHAASLALRSRPQRSTSNAASTPRVKLLFVKGAGSFG